MVPGAAWAADASSTPTPKQLWQAYPLKPKPGGALPSPTASATNGATGGAAASPSAGATAPAGAAAPRATATPAGGAAASASPAATPAAATGSHRGLLIAALALVPLVFIAGLWLGLRRRDRPVPPPEPAAPAPRRFEPRVFPEPARPAPPTPPPPPRQTSGIALAEAVALLAKDTPWPPGCESVWRCELIWRSPEFIARLLAPGAQPPPSPWSPGDATPQSQAEVARLAAELERDGWTPVEPDGRWFSHRYVWTHRGSPPGTEGAA